MSEELIFCPFCGGKAEWCSWDDTTKNGRHWIGCYSKQCARTFDGLETIFYKSKYTAIKAWNRRCSK